jgi:hypothetical protein
MLLDFREEPTEEGRQTMINNQFHEMAANVVDVPHSISILFRHSEQFIFIPPIYMVARVFLLYFQRTFSNTIV